MRRSMTISANFLQALNKLIGLYELGAVLLELGLSIGKMDAFLDFETEANRCRSDRLSPGVKIIGSCRARPKEMCQARCEHRGTTIWQTQIQCVNGRWSPTPACQGASVVKSLEMVNCDQLPVEVKEKTKEKTFCLKITQKITRKSKCPDLVQMRLSVRNCSRDPGSDCRVSCGSESTTLRCLPNGKWSHVPKCVTLKQKLCPVPKEGELLHCSRKEGETCKVVCPDGKLMDRAIVCLPSGEWALADLKLGPKKAIIPDKRPLNVLSMCSCPQPTLSSDEMITTEDCSRKKMGEKCHLGCKKHFAIVGHSFIVCLKDLSWTALPECSDRTCPQPHLKEPLAFAEDCSSKLSGEKCELQCDGFARIVQKSPFRCVNGTHWSQYPHCVCYPPVLPDGMSTVEDCGRKVVGMTCKLKCKGNFSISGSNFITCQNNGSWTSVPSCKKNVCIKPNLPRMTIIPTEDCSSKKIGDTCSLECVKVPETYQIVCLNNTHWSEYPKCSCPTPVVSKNIELAAGCSEKKPGEKCRVFCKDASSSDKHLYISCKNNSEWSSEPSCDKIVCPRPTLPSYLLFDDDCSHKGKGDTCSVVCKTGGTIVGENHIKCLNDLQWSNFPTCTCPKPLIPNDMEALEDCSFKRPNNTCKVKCLGSLADSNHNFLTCLNNATWTDPPSCLKLQCANPDLPSHLKVTVDCSRKRVGDTCEVICKYGGSAIGPNIITCLETLKWSPFPQCTCAEPQMAHGLQLLNSCQNKKPGDECNIKCIEPLKLLGNPSVRCLENSTWSTFPSCSSGSCSRPRIPEHIITPESCNNKDPGDTCKVSCKEGGNLLGDDIIVCLNETHWSDPPLCTCPKPVLKTNLQPITECDSVLPGKECLLKCESNTQISGPSSIICGNDSKWSIQPDCNKIFCKRPTLSPTLDVDDSCGSKAPGEECSVSCKEGGQVLGYPAIKCLNATSWSQEPECACPPPLLDADLEIMGNCDAKKKGENCSVRCKEGKKLIGNPFVLCQNNTRWSTQPFCRINFCAKPFLTGGILEPKEDCTSKIVGETCALRCVEGGKIIGSETIRCLNETDWSVPPACTCPSPDLPENIESAEDCSNKTSGTRCTVACKGFRKLIGDNFITCSEKSKWSSLPLCETLFCPRPLLPKDVLISLKECSFKTAGDTCELACEKGGQMIGKSIITCINGTEWSEFPDCMCESPQLGSSLIIKEKDCGSKERGYKCELACKGNKKLSGVSYIICQNNTEWSPLPVCEEQFCVKPNIPTYLKAQGNCTSKVAGDICELSCSRGGTIIGDSNIKCLSNSSWTAFPTCTCPPLDAKSDINGNCSSVFPGAQCKVTCKSPFSIAEKEFIFCSSQSEWSDLSICKKAACPNMKFSPPSSYVGKCENKSAGDFCYLRCKGSGRFLENINYIRCSKSGEWSKPRKCLCAPITSLSDFELKEDCSKKAPGDNCRIACKNGLDLKDRGFITCDPSYRWSSAPSCQINYCSSPLLPRGLKVIEGNCTQLMIRTSCKLACSNKGIMNGADTLSCSADRKLSKIPTCTCSRPLLPQTMIFAQNDPCDGREIGDICFVYCNSQPGIAHHINCLMEERRMWSPFPDCPCAVPRNLNRYVTLKEDCLRKTTFPVNTTCNVTCVNLGNLLSGTSITCLPGGIWSPSPSCACINPGTERRLPHLNLTQCNFTLPGGSCPVKCTKGGANKAFMHCDEEYNWDEYPTCRVSCQNPSSVLKKFFIGLSASCRMREDFEAGTVCNLECLNGGIYLSSPAIECTIKGTWNSTSQCTCPPPSLNISLIAMSRLEQDACRNKFRGDKCFYECTERGFVVNKSQNFQRCEGDRWVGSVQCMPDGSWCTWPRELTDKRKLLLGDDCSDNKFYPPKAKCQVRCEVATSLLTIPGREMPLQNRSFITCTTTGNWDDLPQCTCPMLRVQPPLVLKKPCAWKIHSDKCQLDLERGYIFKNRLHDYALCIDGTWKNIPEFKEAFCGRVESQDRLLTWHPDCNTGVQVGTRCDLKCRNGATFLGYPYNAFPLECGLSKNTGQTEWEGSVPPCVCPPYAGVPGRYITRKDDKCDKIRYNEKCMVLCILENVWTFITCTADATWTTPVCTGTPPLRG